MELIYIVYGHKAYSKSDNNVGDDLRQMTHADTFFFIQLFFEYSLIIWLFDTRAFFWVLESSLPSLIISHITKLEPEVRVLHNMLQKY